MPRVSPLAGDSEPLNIMSSSTFSYAQAARGRAASQPNTQTTTSPAPSTSGKDDASTDAPSVSAPSVTSNSPDAREMEQQNAQPAPEAQAPKQESEDSSVVGSGSSTESVAEQSTKAAQEGSTKQAETQTRPQGEEKGSRPTSRTSRANEGADGRKGRKGKKGRSSDKDAQTEQPQEEDAEKVKEPPKPVILTEAPLPTVNPWAKRMEAQQAAVKSKQPDSPAVTNDQKQNTTEEDAGTLATLPNGVSGTQKKTAEAARPADHAPRRNGPRGSRAGDKDEKSTTNLPPVADSSSWPDPKSAAEREPLAVRKSQDKPEVIEKENSDEAGPRKKTWEKLEIVHSVVFETQLPPLRGSKPRGGARGGREAGSMRGNHSAAPSTTGAAPQPAATSANEKAPSTEGSAAPRAATARPREGSGPARTATQPQPPHPSKRGSIDAVSREQRKPAVAFTEQARDANIDPSSVSLFRKRAAYSKK